MFIYSTYTKESATKILKQTVHNFYSFENVSTRELLIVEVFFFSFQLYTELVFLGNLKINNHKKKLLQNM